MAHLYEPLVSQGYEVQLWGFNNTPVTIDGDPVPADGGKSAFPAFDHYEQYLQAEIDRAPCMPARHEWLDRAVFMEDCHYPRWGEDWKNILRLHYVYERVEAQLRRKRVEGALGSSDMVVIVYPEMLVGPQRSTLFQELDVENVIGTRNCTDGIVIGRYESVMAWFHHMKSPPTRSRNYEEWFGSSLRAFERTRWSSESRNRGVSVALPNSLPIVTALQKQGLREWVWAVEGFGRHRGRPRVSISASTHGVPGPRSTETTSSAWGLLLRNKRTDGDMSVRAGRDGVRLQGCYTHPGQRSLVTTLFRRLSAAWRGRRTFAFARWKRLLTSPSGLRSAID